MRKCNRKNCFTYNEKLENNCNALNSVYNNLMDCPFFKTKKTLEAQNKKIQERLNSISK